LILITIKPDVLAVGALAGTSIDDDDRDIRGRRERDSVS
jgi:hypothetical protein